MKTLLVVFVGLVLSSTAPVRAQEDSHATSRFIRATFEQTQHELLAGLNSSNVFILSSVAITIRDLRDLYPDRSYAAFVVPLMRILKDENADAGARVSAAIALHELRSAMGDYAISRTGKFTDNERVKHVCSWLAYETLTQKQSG